MVSPLVLRITAPLVIVSLLLLGLGVGAAGYIHHMQRNVSQGLRVNVSSMRAAEEVEILIREMRTQFDRYLLTGEKRDLQVEPDVPGGDAALAGSGGALQRHSLREGDHGPRPTWVSAVPG